MLTVRQSFVYDIRTSENALSTLVNFTGVAPPIWESCMSQRGDYYYEEEFVEAVIKKYGYFPKNYEDWIFIYFHITTSSNGCASIKRHGILDLPNSYLCEDSELRRFLERKGIVIDIDNCKLSYKDQMFDISYQSHTPRYGTTSYACWAVGRKFYYDYTTCGFLSVWEKSSYGGCVHYRPEILNDIDTLLGLTLSQEWHLQHKAYEVVAAVPGTDIVYDGDEDQSDKEKVLYYLTKAYLAAFGSPTEEILLLKNHIQVPANRVVEIKPLMYWEY